jgi:hypothetical protein
MVPGAFMIKNVFLAVSAGLLMCGCISHEETVYHDVERTKVEFENDAAARIFYQTSSEAHADRSREEAKTEVSLPVVFDHKRKVVTGPNMAFNRNVELCDTNKDGRITEQEARIFSEEIRKR